MSFRRNGHWIVVALAVMASITSITNGFAFDDVHIIVNNDRVHSLTDAWRFFGQKYWPPANGDSLYRPLTILAFAIQWALGSGSPLPFHVVNIVLYAVASLCVYRVVLLILDRDAALLAASIFAVHPVHTEVVAGVVGQAELVVGITILLALERYLVARRTGKLTAADGALICGLYGVGCLFKENAIVLPGVLAAAELLTRNHESVRERLRQTGQLFVSLLLTASAFVALRLAVTGGLRAAGTNELLGGEPFSVRLFTMLNIVVEWVRLLLWPSRLSADYSYPQTQLATEPSVSMLPAVLIIVVLALLALYKWRTNRAVAFAVAWMAVSLAIPSNLLMTTGFILAERSLFLASIGAAILVSIGMMAVWRRSQAAAPALRYSLVTLLVFVMAAGIVRSALRNPVWRNNETLFRQTVQDVPLSSRAHWMFAEHLFGSGRSEPAAQEIMRAVMLGRTDDFILLTAAADHLHEARMCERAMPLYLRALDLTPHNEKLRSNAALCLMNLGRSPEARTLALDGLKANPRSAGLHQSVVMADSLASLDQ